MFILLDFIVRLFLEVIDVKFVGFLFEISIIFC